jgi:hypothetical protein
MFNMLNDRISNAVTYLALIEIVILAWFYGVNRFMKNIGKASILNNINANLYASVLNFMIRIFKISKLTFMKNKFAFQYMHWRFVHVQNIDC